MYTNGRVKSVLAFAFGLARSSDAD